MAERKFKYQWKRTWDDQPNDYVVSDGAMKIGRVHVITGGPAGDMWFWAAHGMIGNRGGAASGQALTRDEACAEVESAWDRLKAAVDASRP